MGTQDPGTQDSGPQNPRAQDLGPRTGTPGLGFKIHNPENRTCDPWSDSVYLSPLGEKTVVIDENFT